MIGPNGAGKTTSFNLISGLDRADAGSIRFDGRADRRMRPEAIAALGLARTFQHGRVFANLSVEDNVLIGAHTRLRAARPGWPVFGPIAELALALLRPPAVKREEQALRAEVREILALFGDRLSTASTIPPTACPTPTVAASKSPAPLRCGRVCCCSTSRPPE